MAIFLLFFQQRRVPVKKGLKAWTAMDVEKPRRLLGWSAAAADFKGLHA
ncbi:MAG: hypothetical protein M3R45_11845 [Pseudomonadota bacterium]|nr:hypothetical protein [Pseudomonadota bacterium]